MYLLVEVKAVAYLTYMPKIHLQTSTPTSQCPFTDNGPVFSLQTPTNLNLIDFAHSAIPPELQLVIFTECSHIHIHIHIHTHIYIEVQQKLPTPYLQHLQQHHQKKLNPFLKETPKNPLVGDSQNFNTKNFPLVSPNGLDHLTCSHIVDLVRWPGVVRSSS
ncbi:hypothetical protein M426DRAFT_222291 [Hypoxylon sp. CI-4A]|nr:hypothetical protein M426DRAFT_222291 [Hypoxylon sp. CI-4A]